MSVGNAKNLLLNCEFSECWKWIVHKLRWKGHFSCSLAQLMIGGPC